MRKTVLSIARPVAAVLVTLMAVPPAFARTVRCESKDYRYRYCSVRTYGDVELKHERSHSACRYGRTWGFDHRGIWVDRGCRADFAVDEGRHQNSRYNRYDYCRHDDDQGSSKGAAIAAGAVGAAAIIAAIINSKNKKKNHIIEDLLDQRFDMIASGMAITPKRALVVNFSVPYGHSKAMVIASRKKAKNVKKVDDLNREGVVIGVYEESVNEPLAREVFPNAQIQTFDNEDNLLGALVEGSVDAAITASPGPEFLTHKAPEELFVPFEKPLALRDEAFAIRKGDADFLSYLDFVGPLLHGERLAGRAAPLLVRDLRLGGRSLAIHRSGAAPARPGPYFFLRRSSTGAFSRLRSSQFW